MTSTEILLNLKPEDYASLRKVTGKRNEHINAVILGGIEDKNLKIQAEGMAIINKYGANSMQYEVFMEAENTKALRK